jgi:L-malate glycosyltransferase
MLLKIYNYSNVFGGQERYVDAIRTELLQRNISCEIFSAKSIQAIENPTSRNHCGKFLTELLNGNRALYLRGWRITNADVRVYVQHSHVQDAQGHPVKQWVRKLLLRLLLTRMDVVVRVCDNALPDHYAPGKIHTIHNGVPLPDLPDSPAADRPFTLLMVGAVNENKNQRLALQLLVQLPDVHLVVVGDGPERPALEEWAVAHGVASQVRWTGFLEDPSPFYLQADALLMLSAFEAFPYAVLEAMAHGLPVVGTRVGSVPEAITHEQDGLLLPARDLESVSAAVRRLQADPAWRKQLGQRARQTVRERFTVETMTDRLLNVISQVARKKGLMT